MKNKVIIIEIILLVIAAVGFLTFKTFSKQEEVHYHAGFKVFVDGKLQEFSDIQYMHIEPCGVEEHEEDEQLEKAHLHDGDGDVVHIHRDNATWKDLFINIRYPIDISKPIKGLINGKKSTDILEHKINAYDSVVFIMSEVEGQSIDYLHQAVTRQRIEEVEAKSETCGS